MMFKKKKEISKAESVVFLYNFLKKYYQNNLKAVGTKEMYAEYDEQKKLYYEAAEAEKTSGYMVFDGQRTDPRVQKRIYRDRLEELDDLLISGQKIYKFALLTDLIENKGIVRRYKVADDMRMALIALLSSDFRFDFNFDFNDFSKDIHNAVASTKSKNRRKILKRES